MTIPDWRQFVHPIHQTGDDLGMGCLYGGFTVEKQRSKSNGPSVLALIQNRSSVLESPSNWEGS